MKKRISLIVFVVILLAMVMPAAAITNGVPDGEGHPYVGLIIFDDANGPGWRCTGTLVTPTVVLTAGHCTEGAVAARVWFDTDVRNNAEYPYGGATSIEGTPYAHPQYGQSFPNTADVGVVVLSEAVTDRGFGRIASLGYLDDLATRRGQEGQIFTVVGYGLQEIKPVYQRDLVRYVGSSRLVSLRSSLTDGWNIHTGSDNGKGQGTGGTCFGDSGGPVFHGDSNLVVAVTSFGLNENCKGADFGYRVDTQFTLDWLAGFGVYPN